jgi:hypothetical protein
MTERPVRTLTFGAVGWNDPQVVKGLYPEDVPLSWRLPCYASHFDTVLVPEADWRDATTDDGAAWAGELPSQFWFYLLLEEAPDETRLNTLEALCAALGDRVGGVVLDGPAAGARQAVGDRLGDTPVFSSWGEAGPGRLWTGPDNPCPCGPVGLVSFDVPPSPRALRETVEAFMDCQDAPWAVLFMRAPVSTFDDARVVGQLLGVA